jgi:hypothetical protein
MKSKLYTKKKSKSNKSKSNKSKSNKSKTTPLQTSSQTTSSHLSNQYDNTIHILSYNVSWESMTGDVSNWTLCSNNTNIKNPKHYSVCVNNIANVINDYESSNSENRLDFITLQEATNYQKLIEQSPILQKMNYETHISALDQIITFWTPSYKLLYTLKGEFEKGRPWMCTLFDSGICLINLHMGHYDHHEVYLHIEKMIFKVKDEIKKEIKKEIIKKNVNMNQIRYIVSGDFNYNIKDFGNKNNTIIINGTRFYYNPKNILTCCIKRRRHYDHVIDSFNKPIDITIPKVSYMASDHKPILVKLLA